MMMMMMMMMIVIIILTIIIATIIKIMISILTRMPFNRRPTARLF